MFKDDYLYISYDEPLVPIFSNWGKHDHIVDYTAGDKRSFCIDGNNIVRLILAIEKYSPDVDTTEVRRLIDEKIEYLMKYESDYYMSCFRTTDKVDVFELYGKNYY